MIKRILFTIIISFVLALNVNAQNITCNGDFSASINIDSTSINVGETINIGILESSITSGIDYLVNYKNSNDYISIENINKSAKITGKKMGESTINVEIKFLANNNQLGICNKSIPIKIVSNIVTLSDLNIDKYDLSGIFKSDVYEYNIEVPYEVEKINITGTPTDPNADVTGLGERYLNEGNQSFMILVKNNGESNSYKISVKRLEASNDNTLKSLNVQGYIFNTPFSNSKYEYQINVDESVDSINIVAEANNSFAIIDGVGNHSLVSGKNEFKINVTSQNGEIKSYTIIVNKSSGTSLLKSLKISRYKITPKFHRYSFIYDVYIYDEIDQLKIIASANEGDNIEIIGNKKLKKGKNEIYIKVSGIDKTTSVYKINAYKLNKIDFINNIGKKSGTLTTSLLLLFIVSILVMVGFIMYFIKINHIKLIDKKLNKKKRVK